MNGPETPAITIRSKFAPDRLDVRCHTLQSMAMSLTTSTPAAPTLWRTCRALANRQRLLILCYLVDHPYRSVSEVARMLHLSLPVTSQYLRSLNARGMLRVERVGPRVLYRVLPDPSIPQADALLTSLVRSSKSSKTFVDDTLHALTGFTHPRRIKLVQALARGTNSISMLVSETRISKRAVLRHIDKLCRRGYVERRAHQYRIGRALSPVSAVLLKLALHSA